MDYMGRYEFGWVLGGLKFDTRADSRRSLWHVQRLATYGFRGTGKGCRSARSLGGIAGICNVRWVVPTQRPAADATPPFAQILRGRMSRLSCTLSLAACLRASASAHSARTPSADRRLQHRKPTRPPQVPGHLHALHRNGDIRLCRRVEPVRGDCKLDRDQRGGDGYVRSVV